MTESASKAIEQFMVAPFFCRINQEIEQSREVRQKLRELLQVSHQPVRFQEVVNG